MVRHKKNVSIRRRGIDDLLGVTAGADNVAERFDTRTAIDVSDDVIIFVCIFFQKRGQGGRRTGFRKGAASVEIGQNDALSWVDDLGRLSHEVNAAEKNDLGVGLGRLITKPKRIADEIGHFLKFAHLIVVREDDGVTFAF